MILIIKYNLKIRPFFLLKLELVYLLFLCNKIQIKSVLDLTLFIIYLNDLSESLTNICKRTLTNISLLFFKSR